MRNLYDIKLIARLVLVWFVLSIGAAIASPLVKPQAMQLICSGAGAMKVVATGDDGKLAANSHTLDCPLCASVSAPPPLEIIGFKYAAPRAFAIPLEGAQPTPLRLAAPPPARGPPGAA